MMNNRDTTIDEIHRIRQQMSEKFNGDTSAILEDARQRQAASGHPIWQPPSSKSESNSAAGSSAAKVDQDSSTKTHSPFD